jgi:hypothetical protein
LGPVVNGSVWLGDGDVLADDVLVEGSGGGLGDPSDWVHAAANATITTKVRNRHPTAVIVAGEAAADQTLPSICGYRFVQPR